MKVAWYRLDRHGLRPSAAQISWQGRVAAAPGGVWLDIEDSQPSELGALLEPLALDPQVLKRCLDSKKVPGAATVDSAIMLALPATLGAEAGEPAFLRLILLPGVLLTIHRDPLPAVEALASELTSAKDGTVDHLAQLVYLILDELADLSVKAQIDIRDQALRIARALTEDANEVKPAELTGLRWRVDRLASLTEDQLYCVSGLRALDSAVLKETHRGAYLQDLVSELELAQRGTYRLENRVNDLFNYYQMTQSDQVERRLRVLTIVSVVALPLGLITGLLGMNVGGLPGGGKTYGFAAVMIILVIIAAAELVYFWRRGWFR
jgi:Mg2+ and Co2+ transporter CorA